MSYTLDDILNPRPAQSDDEGGSEYEYDFSDNVHDISAGDCHPANADKETPGLTMPEIPDLDDPNSELYAAFRQHCAEQNIPMDDESSISDVSSSTSTPISDNSRHRDIESNPPVRTSRQPKFKRTKTPRFPIYNARSNPKVTKPLMRRLKLCYESLFNKCEQYVKKYDAEVTLTIKGSAPISASFSGLRSCTFVPTGDGGSTVIEHNVETI